MVRTYSVETLVLKGLSLCMSSKIVFIPLKNKKKSIGNEHILFFFLL